MTGPQGALAPGDAFPPLSLTLVGGDTVTLTDAFAGGFGTVLFYRGAWCPYCNAQLRSFQRAGEQLVQAGVRVAALSVRSCQTPIDSIGEVASAGSVARTCEARTP